MVGCTRSFNPDIERGSSYKFRSGHPEVRLSAIGYLDEEGQPYIHVASDIVYGSLFFRKNEGNLRATIDISLQIVDRNSGDLMYSKLYPTVIPAISKTPGQSQDVYTFEKKLQVPDGEYQVYLSVTDHNTERSITQASNVSIPDSGTSSLTNIRLMGKEIGNRSGNWFPITTYDVPGRIDSLKFIFQINSHSGSRFTIDSRLLRFESDTSAAKPMYANNYSPSSIAYKGIDYSSPDEIQSTRRVLTQEGNVTIEYPFANLDRGNFRFEVNATDESRNKTIFKARDFSRKSENYPTLKTPEELARPLIYLMGRGDHEELMSIQDSDTLKEQIDRFWLRNIQNKSDAKTILRLYYERVEEANKRFSNFKEGWKTDRGLVFILFGSPISIQEIHDTMTWHYSYNRENERYNYTFEKSSFKSEFYPFDYYLLQRDTEYYNLQQQQINLWLSGRIMLRKL